MDLKCESCGGQFIGDPKKHKYKWPKYCHTCRSIKRNSWAGGGQLLDTTQILSEDSSDYFEDNDYEYEEEDLW